MASGNYEIWIRKPAPSTDKGWERVLDRGGEEYFSFSRAQRVAQAQAALPGIVEVCVFERRPVLRLNGADPHGKAGRASESARVASAPAEGLGSEGTFFENEGKPKA